MTLVSPKNRLSACSMVKKMLIGTKMTFEVTKQI
jgi:hypothetical protein